MFYKKDVIMKRLYQKRIGSILLGVVMLSFAGCYERGADYVEDLDIVITKHDTKFDFKKLHTYAIPDKVVKITGNLLEGEDVEFVKDVYAKVILDNLKKNLDAYGWAMVDKNANPDVIILPSSMQSTTIIYYYDWWYWGWYYPYDPWGWYYPYYPYYGGSYTTGSLFIQMTHPDGLTAAGNIPVIWSGVLNGLLEGSTDNIASRIAAGIDQAFTQSPFLKLTNN
jgi:hypothetical protein